MQNMRQWRLRIQQKFLKKGIELRRLIWIVFTVTSVLATALMGISFYFRFTAQSEETLREGNDTRLEATAEQLSTHLRNMMKVSDSLYYRVIKGVDLEENNISDEFRLLYDVNKESIESIALFSIDGTLLCATPSSRLRDNFSLQNEAWYDGALDTEENIRFGAPRVSRVFATEGDSYTRVIPMSRVVQITRDHHVERGVLLVNLRYDTITDMLQNVMVGDHSYVYLIGENGNLLYHPMQALIAAGMMTEETLPLVMHTTQQNHENNETEAYLLKTVGYTGWRLVGVFGQEPLSLHNWKSRSFIVFLLIFFLNAMMLMNFYLSRRVTEPMRRLERAVKKIEAGNLDTKIEASGVYEIQSLSIAIEKMEKNLKQLMEDIVQEHEAKRKSDLMVLQNQINPHFLYNTLDVIVWMIENEKGEEAVKAVTALARFFRISLSKGHTIITVQDEIEHVHNYLMIQEMRFKNKFTYTFDVEDACRNLATVKLILQPLVENAIYHAMEFMDDGVLLVEVYRKGDLLVLAVEDNGCGMAQERVASLLRGDFVQTGKGSGVGLRNVMERIQLLFGEKYGVEITSEPDEGTRVEIHLPAIAYQTLREQEALR